MSLKDQRIVVIGGTSGIGFAVAAAARDEQAKVVVASSNPANVETAVKRLAGSVTGLALDVTNESAVAAAFAQLGAVDHLVFTAGDWKARRTPVAELDLEQARAHFTVRFWGAAAVVKHAYKSISSGGSITLTDGMVARWRRCA